MACEPEKNSETKPRVESAGNDQPEPEKTEPRGDTSPGGKSAGNGETKPEKTEPRGGDQPKPPIVRQISNWKQLRDIKQDLAGTYELQNDIPLPNDHNWQPIGNLKDPFTGSLDGKGHVVRNLMIARENEACVGLIGSIGKHGMVKNIGVELSPNGITGKNRVGALAGGNEGTILNAYAVPSFSGEGGITGKGYIGGLVGSNPGTVHGYAEVAVTGDRRVGGLVGYNDRGGGEVMGYATGDVAGHGERVGGLVGISSGRVVGYATGAVRQLSPESGRAGGLIGVMDGGDVSGYATGAVNGTFHIGGLIGEISSAGRATGYARGVVRRARAMGPETAKWFGRLRTHIGLFTGTPQNGQGESIGYHSAGESTLLDISVENDAGSFRGFSGTAVNYKSKPAPTQATFGKFTFGDKPGQWTWVEEGKWPAINLPSTVGGDYSADSQKTSGVLNPGP